LERRITSFRLSFLQQVLLERLGLQVRPPLLVQRALQVRLQRLVLLAQAQAPLLSCHRQQVPKRSGRRRGFAWS
jgi:hypothetical protein